MGGRADSSRLRKAIGPVVFGLLLFMAFGLGGGFGGRALAAETTMTIISGDIQVRHGATASFVTATDGEVLVAGDTVRTGGDSRADPTDFEGSPRRLDPDTELTIAQ